MRLSNFRIPSAVIRLTIMSSVTVLFFEPFTYAQGAQVVADNALVCASGSGVAGQPHLRNPSCLGGSHKMSRMCAKWEWGIRKANTPDRFGTTPEHCGHKYRADHPGKEADVSAKEACDAAEKDLPTLGEGETWIYKNCKSYQQKG